MAVTLSAEDQALIDGYKKNWEAANAAGDTQGKRDAHNAAEGVRARNGFLGGDDGSQYIPFGTPPPPPPAALPESDKYINDIYTGKIDAATAALDSAYQQNINELSAAAAKIPAQYQTARNQAAAQSDVQRANFNEYAAANGLNSGAGGQAQLAFGSQLQANLSGISQAEADAQANLELQRTQLSVKYKNDIAQAIAEGNFQKAQTLHDDYWRQAERLDSQKQFDATMSYNQSGTDYAKTLSKAELLAGAGDFSGYKALGYSGDELASLQASYLLSATGGKYDSTRFKIFKFAQSRKNQGLSDEDILNQLQVYIQSGNLKPADAQWLVSVLL